MNDQLATIIRDASRPLEPLPTAIEPRLTSLPAIRAVLFDIYGTLLISGSGDVGSADPKLREKAFAAALAAVGADSSGGSARLLHDEIAASHRSARNAGVDYPEVDIVGVWQSVCRKLEGPGGAAGRLEALDLHRLAVEFEVRANPVWTMPGLDDCLTQLQAAGTVLGIISNAQFFTPLAFHVVAGKSFDQYGFDPKLRYYSYEHGLAKPGRALYTMAADQLRRGGIEPGDVLYLGNDMRNDVWPAAEIGFRTGLFAGDRRSLRLREDAPEFGKMPAADVVVTDLRQVANVVE